MFYSEAEQSFNEEIRDKRKGLSGVRGKTGKKGYVGKMLFPSDIMSRKDKYNHRKAGKLVISNLYKEILTIDEFRKLETEEQKNMMLYWRNEYTNGEIKEAMGIANSPYYKLVAELGLPKAPRGPIKNKSRAAKTKIVAAAPKKEEVAPTAAPEAIAAPETPVQEVLVNGMYLVFNGSFSPAHIQNQILKFASMLDGEEDEFYIELKLMQKSKA